MKVAVYVRKSKFIDTSESVENQIKLCKEKIYSLFKNEDIEFTIFQDEGYSGATTNRPKFKELINNLKSFDVLVCYRLDRISRNVADFAETFKFLEANNCDFVSASENHDTTSPLGRAMLYMASVFAQLERETTAERIRDNMLTLAKDGKWTGGRYPLGFKGEKSTYISDTGMKKQCSKLVIDENDIEIVKLIYKTYLNVGSLAQTETVLMQNGIKNKDNKFFDCSSLKIILSNPVYCKANKTVYDYLANDGLNVYGEVDNIHSFLSYNKTSSAIIKGKKSKINNPKNKWIVAITNIEGIFEAEYWLSVQNILNGNSSSFPKLPKKHTALLSGKVYCSQCGSKMIVRNGKKLVSGIQQYDYTCSLKRRSKLQLCQSSNINTTLLDSSVILKLKELWPNKQSIITSLKEENIKEVSNDPKEEIKILSDSILTRKKQIDNLLTLLSNDITLKDEIFDKITKLKNEINDLQIKIETLNNSINKFKNNKYNVELIEELLSKCKDMDVATDEEKKFIVSMLIDSVYADKDSGKLHINFNLDILNKKK